MPQLNVLDFSPQLIWLAISFVALYFLMSRLALPAIGGVIEARAAKIRGDLDRAAALKAEAEAAMNAYEGALAEARGRAQEMTRATDAALAKQATERQATLAAELAGRIRDAEASITGVKTAAIGNIAAVAADAAQLAVERVAGLAVTPDEATAAARAALAARRA